ncbi:MAG: UDP-N-acetyl-D-glucosamine 2-epimerase, UDP-hydrolyzing [Deferribacteraceae bacterium]|jgi:UDP-hydrolysing UDP-N-acetyl-D-glucosamine 2-epimerase|nr:UDP-N-acetyl-D-glucosamine 2-epimerase, UDP-hydrolyzing [Deferribacteraceae bacterium]
MKRKIAVITGTRAEYGLLYWTMRSIQKSSNLKLQLIVTGMHLAPQFGNTYKFIEQDGFHIDKKVDILISNDTPVAISKSMGLGIIGFAESYEELKPDILLVLGDRYEILAAASAAIPFNIPIAHIHGGEITEGAIDEQIRHAITKLSHLHFASTEIYAQNIRKMGEEAWRVFCVGAPGLEWIHHNQYMSKQELEKDLNVDFSKDVILATFHSVTLEQDKTEEYIDSILQALIKSEMQVIFTGANSDPSGAIINKKVKEASKNYLNIHYFDSLGQRKYLSCQKYCTLMLGNSSSGIIEAASFGLPVVNIGIRQKGRLQSGNVINVRCNVNEILQGIQIATSKEFKQKVLKVSNIYGDGYTSQKIVKILENVDLTKLKYKRLVYE